MVLFFLCLPGVAGKPGLLSFEVAPRCKKQTPPCSQGRQFEWQLRHWQQWGGKEAIERKLAHSVSEPDSADWVGERP